MSKSLCWVLGTSLALVLLGCGLTPVSKQDDETRWVNETGLLITNFKKSRDQTFQQIGQAYQAGNADQLAAAFASYGRQLSDLESKIKGTNPPEQCKHVQQVIIDLLDQTQTLTSRLSSSGAVDTQGELLQAAQDAQVVQQRAASQIDPFVKAKHC
jgi:hypothetical protein